jgi:ribonucleoside-triphosphate reductase (formate)
VYNYPFLMGQGVWRDSENLHEDDEVREVIKHGTLTLGFIGLAEAMVALFGKHHGQDKNVASYAYDVVKSLRKVCDDATEKYQLNFSLIATPAEGLSGRFTRMDRKKFGIIQGVTDREFYTNSMHVPVYFPISIWKKIDIEAPYHELCNGGHISYVELDGDVSKNPEAFEAVIKYMADAGIGYGAVNVPVDFDPVCGYTGVIGDTCPRCGRKDGEKVSAERIHELRKKYHR